MAAPNRVDVGDRIRIRGVFQTLAGVDTDPTTIVCKYRDPSGNVTTKTYGSDGEVVKDATGRFHLDIDVDEEGTWTYRWNGTGAIVAAGEQTFVARNTAF